MLEEFKKVKVSLPLFELMKVPDIRDTLMNGLNESTAGKAIAQTSSNIQRVTNVPQASINVVQDEPNIQQLSEEACVVQDSSNMPYKEELVKTTNVPKKEDMLEGKAFLTRDNVKRVKDSLVMTENPTKGEILPKSEIASVESTVKNDEVSKESVKNEENLQVHRDKPALNYQDEPAPFLLSVRIFGKLLHNCLVDSGASSNVMPKAICKKLGLIPIQTSKRVTQLDKTEVPVIEELSNIHMPLVADPRVQHFIDISVVDIPDGYGMLLSRD